MFVPYYDEFCVYLTQDDIIDFIEDKFNENNNIKKEELYEICLNYFGITYDFLISEILEI